jgi:hypothetical protein
VAGEVPEVGGIVCIRGRPEPVGQGERAFCGKHPFQGDRGYTGLGCWNVEGKSRLSTAGRTIRR